MLIKVKEAIIVEGKYDKIKLSSIVDGLIIETNGFRIFKDKKKLKLIRKLANERGIIIFTDSDASGFVIRNYLSGLMPKDKVKHAYIPDVYGKEKRKEKYSKEGKLGVEGLENCLIIESLNNSAMSMKTFANNSEKGKQITKLDFFDDGIYGKNNSYEKRKIFIKNLNLPEYLSVNALLDVVNNILTFDEYKKLISTLFYGNND